MEDAHGWSARRQLADGQRSSGSEAQLVDASHPFAQIRNEENCLLINTGTPKRSTSGQDAAPAAGRRRPQ